MSCATPCHSIFCLRAFFGEESSRGAKYKYICSFVLNTQLHVSRFSQGSGSIRGLLCPGPGACCQRQHGLNRALVSPPSGRLPLSGLVFFIVIFQSFMKSNMRFQTHSKHNCRNGSSFSLALGSCSTGIIICITPTLKIQVISGMSL